VRNAKLKAQNEKFKLISSLQFDFRVMQYSFCICGIPKSENLRAEISQEQNLGEMTKKLNMRTTMNTHEKCLYRLTMAIVALTLTMNVHASEWLKTTSQSKTLIERIDSAPGRILYITARADITVTGANQNEVAAEATFEISDEPPEIIEQFFA
jgi:hypothetical protein